MRPGILETLVLTCACVAAHAQERRPCVGRVVDAAGKSLAAATVTLVSTPLGSHPAGTDAVTVIADQHGGFVAALILGEVYTAWAVGPQHADGTAAVSEPLDLVGAGRVIELRATHTARPQNLQIIRLEAWLEVGPLTARVYPDSRHDFGLDLAIDDQGNVTIPPIAHAAPNLALVDAAGQICAISHVGEVLQTTTVRFDPPRPLSARVVGPDGKPLAGAVVESALHFAQMRPCRIGLDPWSGIETGTIWRRVAVADPDGVATGLCGWHDLRASAAGFQPESFDVQPVGITGVLSLARGEPVRIRVEGGGPQLELPLELVASAGVTDRLTLRRSDGSWPLSPRGKNEWTCPAPPDGRIIATRARPVSIDGVPTRFQLGSLHVDEGVATIDLGRLVRWQVRIVDAEGAPAPAVIGTATAEGGPLPTMEPIRIASDALGRADLWLGRCKRVIYATTGTTHATAIVDPRDGNRVVRLVLEPIPTIRLHVVDADGRAVAGALACSMSWGFRLRRPDYKPLTRFWGALPTGSAGSAFECWRSAADGSITLPAVVDGDLALTVSIRKAGRCVTLPLKPGADVQVVLK